MSRSSPRGQASQKRTLAAIGTGDQPTPRGEHGLRSRQSRREYTVPGLLDALEAPFRFRRPHVSARDRSSRCSPISDPPIPYVGMMKGVISASIRDANVVDITHDIPPQDIDSGRFFPRAAAPLFPAGHRARGGGRSGVGSRAAHGVILRRPNLRGARQRYPDAAAPRATRSTLTRGAVCRCPHVSQHLSRSRSCSPPVPRTSRSGVPLDALGPARPGTSSRSGGRSARKRPTR